MLEDVDDIGVGFCFDRLEDGTDSRACVDVDVSITSAMRDGATGARRVRGTLNEELFAGAGAVGRRAATGVMAAAPENGTGSALRRGQLALTGAAESGVEGCTNGVPVAEEVMSSLRSLLT